MLDKSTESLERKTDRAWTENPIITVHARNRAHKRFGVAKKSTARWIRKHLNSSEYVTSIKNGSDRYKTHVYKSGGVLLLMRGRYIVTICQETDDDPVSNQVRRKLSVKN